MSFLLKILNCAIAAVITTLTVKKLMKFVKPKRIEQVLFANNASGCCSDFSNDNSCGSRYCLNKNVRLIVNLINQCQYSVCLALYSLDLHEVTEAILNAQRRKIDVKIIASAAVMHNLSRKFTRLSLSGKNSLEKIDLCLSDNCRNTLLDLNFVVLLGRLRRCFACNNCIR
ncbi:hypothetical protein Bhyg_11502 [Pseudolycoriella hygida]|uniref:Phospholipase D-like domain-containing protein n=1 Tax=Pseudolycoriella hygida TaxID=35572 RepID=A0A9Q0MX12_9DIPT|nr:hypothetical protein Bhyg_11502 [Pseudolycoriella hygida]